MIITHHHKQFRQIWERNSFRSRTAGEKKDFQKRIARLKESINQRDLFDDEKKA